MLTVADAEAEPVERVRFDLASLTPGGNVVSVIGTVTDGAPDGR